MALDRSETRADRHLIAYGKTSLEAALTACQAALAHRPSGLVTDFDGTVSQIVADPDAASILPLCRDALASLADDLDLVGVLSGRMPQDARDRVGLDGIEYVGVHGLVRLGATGPETHPLATPFEHIVESVAPALRRHLDSPGIFVEDKGPALAVHYRQAPDQATARELVLDELGRVADAHGMALFEGRMVVELRPPLPLGKGWSLLDIAQNRTLRSLIYLGDDRTDVEAFDALQDWREEATDRCGVAIGVLSPEMPAALLAVADFLLEDVAAVELLLSRLAKEIRDARSASASLS
ncbi:MAG: trehalose-phosphatase [Chloroflexi bacterium]|nr:trehalose-phosphatase [Chloroflexota bacterium]